MVEKAILNILTTVNELSAVEKHFAVIPEKNTQDFLVYYRTVTEPNDTKTGRSTLDEVTIQINIFSYQALRCANYAEAVRGNLDRRSGTFEGIFVQSIQFQNEMNMFEFNEVYNPKGLYQITQFYKIRTKPNYQ